ncbi:MAG: hypothetical protein ACYDBY_13885 [Thermoanaerobaculia bacterium]
MPLVDTPFRALFLLRSGMENIEVIPLGSTGPLHGAGALGGALEGRAELLAFVTAIGFDSLVESFQVSDLPRLSFLRTFHLAASPEEIVRILDQRLLAAPRFTHKVLALSDVSAPEQLTLAPQEAFQLGITTVSVTTGIERTRRWFEEHLRG